MSRKKTKLSADINVVPYIDVMLVLLIIFMITAPMLEQGVDVDLPSTENNEQVDMPTNNAVFLVSVDADGQIYASFDDDTIEVTEDELVTKSKFFFSNNPTSKAFLKSDKDVLYGRVITIMDLLKSSGYTKVGLISKQK